MTGALSNRVTFIEEPHAYHWEDGAPVACSVTEALKITGYLDPSHYTDFGRQRGSYVHQMLEWHDRGELAEDTLDPALVPYLKAYGNFMAQHAVAWDSIELRLGDRARNVAGTLDRIGAFGLLDIKSGGSEPWHALQTACYALLAQTNGLILSARRVKRWGLYLTSNGKYDLRPHDGVNDVAVANALMTVAVDKVTRGLVTREEGRAA